MCIYVSVGGGVKDTVGKRIGGGVGGGIAIQEAVIGQS